MEDEIWKDIIGYEEYYAVSNFGRFKSKERYVINHGTRVLKKERILKGSKSASGYIQVRGYIDGKNVFNKYVHDIVAEYFIPNDDISKNEVNHINHNKLNNCYKNLEWVTHKENIEKMLEFYQISVKKEKKQKDNFVPPLSRNDLKKLIRNESFEYIARIFKKKTGNTVKKWCDYYSLPRRKKDIDNISDEEWSNV